MPTIEVNDEQILRCLDQLSPAGRRAALQKLLGGLDRLDRLIERLEELCHPRRSFSGQPTSSDPSRGTALAPPKALPPPPSRAPKALPPPKPLPPPKRPQ